jgi:hypothetical protein
MTERWAIQVSSALRHLAYGSLPIDMDLTRIGEISLAIASASLMSLVVRDCGSHNYVHLATTT